MCSIVVYPCQQHGQQHHSQGGGTEQHVYSIHMQTTTALKIFASLFAHSDFLYLTFHENGAVIADQGATTPAPLKCEVIEVASSCSSKNGMQ